MVSYAMKSKRKMNTVKYSQRKSSLAHFSPTVEDSAKLIQEMPFISK